MDDYIIQEAYNHATKEWMDSGEDPKILWKRNIPYLMDHISKLDAIFDFLKTSSIQYLNTHAKYDKDKQINTMTNLLDLEYRACVDIATNNFVNNISKN